MGNDEGDFDDGFAPGPTRTAAFSDYLLIRDPPELSPEDVGVIRFFRRGEPFFELNINRGTGRFLGDCGAPDINKAATLFFKALEMCANTWCPETGTRVKMEASCFEVHFNDQNGNISFHLGESDD